MLGKMKKVLNNGKGFSLVELIVVIAILGILAGIAAPNVIRYIDNSRKKADVSTAAVIGNAVIAGIADETITSRDVEYVIGDAAGAADITTSLGETLATIPEPKYQAPKEFSIYIDADGNVEVGIEADGTVSADIDGAVTTELFPVTDASYE